MGDDTEFGYGYASSQISRSRHPLRKLIKQFYVERVVRNVTGKTIDLGCGAGQILSKLPHGSLGIEINPYLVKLLNDQGLNVQVALESDIGFNLSKVEQGVYKTLVLSHVLEHFHDAEVVLKKLLKDCSDLGIVKVIIVVPTIAGYRSDSTHKTFIDTNFLKINSLTAYGKFRLTNLSYFPWNSAIFQNLFTYHEMMLIFEVGDQIE